MRHALVALAAIATLTACGGGDGDSTAAEKTSSERKPPLAQEERNQVAYEECVEGATDLLKAPATAQFADLDETTISNTGPNYTVAGEVDSENSFGALIRNSFSCEVYVTAYGGAGDAQVVFSGS